MKIKAKINNVQQMQSNYVYPNIIKIKIFLNNTIIAFKYI